MNSTKVFQHLSFCLQIVPEAVLSLPTPSSLINPSAQQIFSSQYAVSHDHVSHKARPAPDQGFSPGSQASICCPQAVRRACGETMH